MIGEEKMRGIVFSGMLIFQTGVAAKNVRILTHPKSGTHLLNKCIRLITEKDKNVVWSRIEEHSNNMQHSDKMVTMLRDPRDWLISYFLFQAHLGKIISIHKSFDQILTEILIDTGKGFNSNLTEPRYLNFKTIKQCYEGFFLPLFRSRRCYTTYFEKLVGEKGGGSLEAQMLEVKNIAHHLNINLTVEEIEEIAQKLFGGTPTFMKGLIGQWKLYFTEEHKKLFKKNSGSFLIQLGYESDNNW